MAVETNLPAEGAIGLAPPAGAPIESSQPLREDAGRIVIVDPRTGQPTGEVVDPASRAAANERVLAPLTYGKTPEAGAVAPQSVVAGKAIDGLDPFYAAKMHPANAQSLPAPSSATASAGSVGPADPSMPAASNTDSPSRGIPGTAPVPAARKRAPLSADGGFGSSSAAQYFPMTGAEAREMAMELMDRLHARLQNDLRFSMAVCYPRIAVKLMLVIEAEAEGGFQIESVAAHEKTPIDVAREYADHVVFVLREQRREFDEHGNVETPPDAMRDELGILKPKKQMVQTGAGKQFADVPLNF